MNENRNDKYIPERIDAWRQVGNHQYICVKWKGYGQKFNTWELSVNFEESFLARYALPKGDELPLWYDNVVCIFNDNGKRKKTAKFYNPETQQLVAYTAAHAKNLEAHGKFSVKPSTDVEEFIAERKRQQAGLCCYCV